MSPLINIWLYQQLNLYFKDFFININNNKKTNII